MKATKQLSGSIGEKLGRRNSFRKKDDTTFIAESDQRMVKEIERVEEENLQFGLRLNRGNSIAH